MFRTARYWILVGSVALVAFFYGRGYQGAVDQVRHADALHKARIEAAQGVACIGGFRADDRTVELMNDVSK